MRRHAGLALFGLVSVALGLTVFAAPSDAVAQGTAKKATAKSTATASAKASASAAPLASGETAPSAPAASAAAPATSGVPAGPSTGSAAQPGSMDGATYTVRLRDLESRVDELKDQIRRSHTRLSLLSDTILTGGASGSRAEVVFKNEISGTFKLIRALVIIDGAVQYNKQDDSGALAEQKEIPIFTGSVAAGDHSVQIALTLQGSGSGGLTYMRGYKFDLKSSHSFTAVEGKMLTLSATAYEKGGVTTPVEQRPSIEWQEKVVAGSAAVTPKPAASAAGGSK